MSSLSEINEEMLDTLRQRVGTGMSEKRYRHTLGVEREIARLGEIYLPDRIQELRAAALLHDITKERSVEEQLALCAQYSIPVTAADRISPKTFHAKTACPVIAEFYPEYATQDVLDAIRKHTTGARDMSLFAKLLYLADYIDDTRTFPDCVKLRALFWQGYAGIGTNKAKLLEHLDRILLTSYDMTVSCLIREEAAIAPETVDARNALLEKFASV